MTLHLLSEPAAPSFDDPLGMLAACHRRIESQLATLAAIGAEMAARREVDTAAGAVPRPPVK